MTTYITLVNQLLRRINETELDTTGDGFGNVRNLQALSKDAINSSIREILQVSQEWPFTLVTYTQAMTAGTGVYTDYLKTYRPAEDLGGESARTIPQRIYQTQESKFGVTPIPDSTYDIEYRYWSFPADLSAYNDTSVVPDRFNTVVIDGAMMYIMRFRSNDQSGQIHEQKFKDGINNMRRLLLDSHLQVTSTLTGSHFNTSSGTR